MRNMFVTGAEAADIARSGVVALFAGSEASLRALPPGRWIGGTTIYFMTRDGGIIDAEGIFCSIIDEAIDARFGIIRLDDIVNLTAYQFANGFTYLMVPAFCTVHTHYAVQAPRFPDLYTQPVAGWVTGVAVDDTGTCMPKVFHGPSGQAYADAMLALYVRLADGMIAACDTVNLFTQGDGPAIIFPETGFDAQACLIDSAPGTIGQYLADADEQLPLVADYAGIMMNVGVRRVDAAEGRAQFYAPVIAGETYRLGRAIDDYSSAYRHGAAASQAPEAALSCNCIVNFLHAGLEGKSTGGYVGPVTFGEISTILVNQTLVRLWLEPASRPEPGT